MTNKKKKTDAPKEIIHSFDPLEEIEEKQHSELSGRMHELAQPPTKLPKKKRGSPKESCRPLHRR